MPKMPTSSIEHSQRLTEAEIMRLRLQGLEPIVEGPAATLSERFLLPPFSVLDARQGYWQTRKRAWLSIGIQSELGRGETPSTSARVGPDDEATYRTIGGKSNNGLLGFSEQARSHYKKPNATPGGSPLPAASLKDGKTQRGDGRGRPLATTYGSGGPGDLAAGFKTKVDNRAIKDHAWLATHDKKIPQMGIETETASLSGGLVHGTTIHHMDGSSSQVQSGTSIFDPVICELAYRWFTPVGGRVLDPFAGGSVRGIVAAKLRRSYTGIDLRGEQIEANEKQAKDLCPDADLRWFVGDSQDVSRLVPGKYDFVFSCPPYADLERYSDDPRDISTMNYDEFMSVYRKIIAESCLLLADNRFACFVVGDVRDPNGNYRNFVADTVSAFRDAGLHLYNEAILVTSVGSLPIRVGRQFAASRKLGKTHQNVLVFVKGNPTIAVQACGTVDTGDLVMPPVDNNNMVVSVEDVRSLAGIDYLSGMVTSDDVVVVEGGLLASATMCDLLRSEGRKQGKQVRTWLPRDGAWIATPDNDLLTAVVGQEVILHPNVFPKQSKSTAVGKSSAPPVSVFKFGGKSAT